VAGAEQTDPLVISRLAKGRNVIHLDPVMSSNAHEPAAASPVFDEFESNVRSYSRLFPTTFSRAKGSLLYDVTGRSYIDFLAGAGALNFGHNHETIKSALIDYVAQDGLAHGLDLQTRAKATFLDALVSQVLLPRGLNYRVQFTGPTGTDAVEAALKVARRATERTGIFAFMGGYHGNSLGSLAATASRVQRRAAGVGLGSVTFVPFPGTAPAVIDTIAYLRSLLEDSHSGIEVPAGIIVETVQGEGGVNVAPIPWLQELRAVCDDYGIVLIVDEIQTGVGRTGPFFSFEAAGIVPDLVVVSKSISGFGQPMALTLIRPSLDVWQPGEHTGTFRGNQLAFVTGAVAISLFEKEAIEPLTERNAEHVRARLVDEMRTIDSRLDVRGRGMIWGVDTSAVDATGSLSRLISRRSFADGLVIECAGRNDSVLKLLPPLTIERDELDGGLSILAGAARAALRS
jgi:diaminobutyrate-2-oxoglutarate transaminase